MRQLKTAVLFTVALTALSLTACKETEKDKIGDAQFCLDNSTSANAEMCLSSLSGIESAAAYTLRCSANFITQGLGDAATLANALNTISNGGSDNSTLFSVLAFKGANTTIAGNLAATALSNCQKSGQKGLQLIASMAQMATSFAILAANVSNPSAGDIQTQINALAAALNGGAPTADQTAQAQAIGSAVKSTYTTSCQQGTPANKDLCTQLDTAFSTAGISADTATNEQIAAAIAAKYQH